MKNRLESVSECIQDYPSQDDNISTVIENVSKINNNEKTNSNCTLNAVNIENESIKTKL